MVVQQLAVVQCIGKWGDQLITHGNKGDSSCRPVSQPSNRTIFGWISGHMKYDIGLQNIMCKNLGR